jgi:hypothetical protein
MIFIQQIPIPLTEHGTRILCAEYDEVHDGRVQPVAGDGNRIKGIPRQYKAFPQAVIKPLRVKSRYVGAVSGLDDHCNASPIDDLFTDDRFCELHYCEFCCS